MPLVGIPYAPMPAEQSPNIRPDVGADDVYLKCSFVALASFGRWNPGWRRALVTNVEPDPKWQERFGQIGAGVVLTPFDHLPPGGFAPTFAGSLFLLDAIENVATDDYLLLIDPDVIVVGSVASVLDSDQAVAALNIPYDNDHDINRLTLIGAQRIHRRLGQERERVLHYGGEMYGIPARLRPLLQERIERAWRESIDGFQSGREFFTTEEHMISFALAEMPVRESSDLIRRIWTAHGYRTVDGREHELALWHLPAEKQRSLSAAYDAALDPDSWFWQSSRLEFIDRIGRLAGFHHRDPQRLAKDTAGRLWRAARQKTGR